MMEHHSARTDSKAPVQAIKRPRDEADDHSGARKKPVCDSSPKQESMRCRTVVPITVVPVLSGQAMSTLTLEAGAQLVIYPDAVNVLPPDVAALQSILERKERLQFRLYGRDATMRRQQAIFGIDMYRFSGNVLMPETGAMPVAVQQCIAFVAHRDQQPVSRYWALVNWYPHASDYISAHSDDEKEVGVVSEHEGPTVATFTFGAVPRVFRIARKPSSRRNVQPLPPQRWDVALPHGSCAIMAGTRFQTAYTHEVRPLSQAAVRTAEAAGHAIGRLSITVRARCDTASPHVQE